MNITLTDLYWAAVMSGIKFLILLLAVTVLIAKTDYSQPDHKHQG